MNERKSHVHTHTNNHTRLSTTLRLTDRHSMSEKKKYFSFISPGSSTKVMSGSSLDPIGQTKIHSYRANCTAHEREGPM